jgi:tetratricopeptide (TPR) repeat protein
VSDSVEALVSGVLEANAKFFETTRVNIRVGQLDIVEIYLDTAITAVYALRQLSGRLGALAQRQRSMLVCKAELTQGEGVRQRLFDRSNLSYWPRLIVTDADRRDDDNAAEYGSDAAIKAALEKPRTAIADRLRFLYVGQRARAESVVHQRQPGLIEALVRQQIANPVWNADIGRMLFQLMVPPDFKDAARQLDRVVLVVDAYTANLPWELMSADHPDGGSDQAPLALRTPVVRQLESPRFRRQVRQSFERTALVVGNPSVEGFAAAYKLPREPDALAGAEAEAESVVAVLSGMDYKVTREIGADRQASDVLAALYRQPYRFLHISAHGVFDQLHADGRRRSGVVLSGGLLITAAEIDAMETVPELVFLNCCHLGKVDATVRDGNRLAASVARALIQIGVRCVIVAGWAVDDRGAKLFGETFYRQLLLERRAFGEAVFEARKAVWDASPTDITWGAFQAYGDAGWLAEPVRDSAGWRPRGDFVSAEEALDELASLRATLSRKKTRLTDRESAVQVRAIEQLKDRMPAGWLGTPMLQSALGRTWADLGQFDKARTAYLAAVQAEDKRGHVPIRDIEQLASVETKLGEKERDEAQIRRALERLDELDRLVSSAHDDDSVVVHSERSALRGSGWKRLASVHARRVLTRDAEAADLLVAGQTMQEALAESAAAYGRAEGVPGQPHFSPYHALNRLALYALSPPAEEADDSHAQRDSALALAQQCSMSADAEFRRDGDFFNAVMSPETLLVQRLLDRSFGGAGDAGDLVFEDVARAYADALSNITLKPKDLDTVLDQLCLFSRFHDAFSVVERSEKPRSAAEHGRIADRLIALAERLLPGACRRDDRPGRKGRPAAAAKVAAEPVDEVPAVAGLAAAAGPQPVAAAAAAPAQQAVAKSPTKAPAKKAVRKQAARKPRKA